MIGSSALIKPAVGVAAIALVVGLGRSQGGPAPVRAPSRIARAGLDATSDAEARRLRKVTRSLSGELSAAARCGTPRFRACVAPALRRAGIGGRMTAMLARGVMARVPAGPCREFLFGLQAANDAAGDEARWLLPLLYDGGRHRHEREIAGQAALAGRMLHRAGHAAAVNVCAPAADGPPS
jgi:hypothetical protein